MRIVIESIRLLWLLIPCIFLLYFCKNLLFPSRWYKSINLNSSQRKGLYYSSVLLWYIIFCVLFEDFITSINLTDTYKITKEVHNYGVLTVVFIVISIVIDIIIFKNINISKLNIKGIELTVDEVNDITESSIIRKEDYILICNIILEQYEIISKIKDYVNGLSSINENTIYKDLLNVYFKKRNNIEFQCYYNDNDDNGFKLLKEDNRISDNEFSAIQYSLLVNGVCIPPQDKLRVIYANIITSFVFPDLLLVIKSNGDNVLFEHEHLIIQNIISIFDKELFIFTKEE